MINLEHKRVYIAPHTPKTVRLAFQLQQRQNIELLGFIDKVKLGEGIFNIEEVYKKTFDYVLIYSPNHFTSIYKDYKKRFHNNQLLQIEVEEGVYQVFQSEQIKQRQRSRWPEEFRLKFLNSLVTLFDWLAIERKSICVLSKGFVGTNNKVIFNQLAQSNSQAYLLTDNTAQYQECRSEHPNIVKLGSVKSCFLLAGARAIIQDQGNSNSLVSKLSKRQIKIQLWHGIPLKHLNHLVDIEYNYHIGTSSFVNQTSLAQVIPAKEHLDLGYPRNDLLLKTHQTDDLLLTDPELYALAQAEKIIVYMPTHREAEPVFDRNESRGFPINFEDLNDYLCSINHYLLLKLHPFSSKKLEGIHYSHIRLCHPQSDIYPILKYTDILITDYSSVYFDYLLLNRPIIFYCYDLEEYQSHMDGFFYDYEEFTPGCKVRHYSELKSAITAAVEEPKRYSQERRELVERLFTYQDKGSARRIAELIEYMSG